MKVRLGTVKMVCRWCWELLLGPLVWCGYRTLAVSTGLNSLCHSLGCLCLGYGLCGFTWVDPLVGCCLGLVVGLSLLVPLVAYAQAMGGEFGLSLLCPGCGLVFIWLVCLLAYMWGLILVCLSSARDVGLV